MKKVMMPRLLLRVIAPFIKAFSSISYALAGRIIIEVASYYCQNKIYISLRLLLNIQAILTMTILKNISKLKLI